MSVFCAEIAKSHVVGGRLLGKHLTFFNFYNSLPSVLCPQQGIVESIFKNLLSAMCLFFFCQEASRKWILCCLTSRRSSDAPAGILLTTYLHHCLTNLSLYFNIVSFNFLLFNCIYVVHTKTSIDTYRHHLSII